ERPTSVTRIAPDTIGGVTYLGCSRKITSPTCAMFPNADIHEKLVLWVAIRVAPKMACVKKAKPAYNTATNQRLLLRDESASIVNAPTEISTSDNIATAGIRYKLCRMNVPLPANSGSRISSTVAGTQVTKASAAISVASLPATYCVRVTGRDRYS